MLKLCFTVLASWFMFMTSHVTYGATVTQITYRMFILKRNRSFTS
jgi:hypothetical protein